MSDEKPLETITIKRRAVFRNGNDNKYYIHEYKDGSWIEVSKGYPHSTSAYAQLGRIINRECQSDLKY